METTNMVTLAVETSKAKDFGGLTAFNMRSLSVHLPLKKRRGLSKYFSGKSRSFACLADAKSIEDLQKAEVPEAKRRKYSDQRKTALLPALSRMNGSSS